MSYKKKEIERNKIKDNDTKKTITYAYTSFTPTDLQSYQCWWCTLLIEKEPIGCPISLSHVNNKKVYSVDGLFCSFNCVKAYILEKITYDTHYKNSRALLAMMKCDSQNIYEPTTIEPALDKKFLIAYGGHLTPEQYKKQLGKILYLKRGIVTMFPVKTIYEEIEKC